VPYTFILRATSEVPRRLMHPKRRTVGLRVPDNAIAQALLADLERAADERHPDHARR
jgi:tRNA A37 threonylcarbamoyladenosine synthetase subunit TsaC/SUA5/YrdC